MLRGERAMRRAAGRRLQAIPTMTLLGLLAVAVLPRDALPVLRVTLAIRRARTSEGTRGAGGIGRPAVQVGTHRARTVGAEVARSRQAARHLTMRATVLG